jgi:hypothetical protein
MPNCGWKNIQTLLSSGHTLSSASPVRPVLQLGCATIGATIFDFDKRKGYLNATLLSISGQHTNDLLA